MRSKINPIDPSVFVDPPVGTFGTMGRNSLHADRGRNLALSLFRAFKLSETKRFEFRAEAFNATNTPLMGTPATIFWMARLFRRGALHREYSTGCAEILLLSGR
jgi:hypothetical protein